MQPHTNTIDAAFQNICNALGERLALGALASAEGYLSGKGVTLNGAAPSKLANGATKPAPAAPAAKKNGKPKKGAKRSPEQLEAVKAEILEKVDAAGKEGLRCEDIARDMKVTTKEITLPLRNLVKNGELKTKGVKRSMKYFTS